MAQTFYSQNKQLLDYMIENQYPEILKDENDTTIKSWFIGSFLTLDPCGRYHHCISPNGLTNRCIKYWESLDNAASKLNGWIESGEGDPLDIYFCMITDEAD